MPLLAPMAVLGPPPLPLLLSFSRILLPHVSHQLFLFFLFLPWKKKKKILEDFQPSNGNSKMKMKRRRSSPCFCPVASHPHPAEGQPMPAAWPYGSRAALRLWGALSAGDLHSATAARK